MATNIILFPNMRTPLIQVVRYWCNRGFYISNNRRGRLVLVKA